MKKYPIVLTTVLTLGMAIGLTFDSHAAKEVLTNYQFGKTNPLATGKWVKISIEGSAYMKYHMPSSVRWVSQTRRKLPYMVSAA